MNNRRINDTCSDNAILTCANVLPSTVCWNHTLVIVDFYSSLSLPYATENSRKRETQREKYIDMCEKREREREKKERTLRRTDSSFRLFFRFISFILLTSNEQGMRLKRWKRTSCQIWMHHFRSIDEQSKSKEINVLIYSSILT